jgi:hypothetical protein
MADAFQPHNPVAERPPVLSPAPSLFRQLLMILLSLCLGLYLADAIVSVADSSLILFFGIHALTGLEMCIGIISFLLLGVVYVLMVFTPAIPKRWFVTLTLFCLIGGLLTPIVFLFPQYLLWSIWTGSLTQLLLGFWVLYQAQRGVKFGWPLVPASRLGAQNFTWTNLIGFAAANLFILVPAILIYLFSCAAWAIHRSSDGFMTLHPGGLTVQVRKYIRADGKTIQLFPMMHIADKEFYQRVEHTFPINSVILMEGVTDDKHLLKNKLSYVRAARKLGLTEQHEAFDPVRGTLVMADVDVSVFSTNTLDMLNLVIAVHVHGLDTITLQRLTQYPMTPELLQRLQDDLVGKRNQHLLGEIRNEMSQTDYIVVPWGAAHMPGIAREIQKDGFRLVATQNYDVIRW